MPHKMLPPVERKGKAKLCRDLKKKSASELHVVGIGQPVHHDADRHAQRRLPEAVVAVIHVLEPYGRAVQIEHDGVEELGHLLRESLDSQAGQPAPLRHAGVNLAEPVAFYFLFLFR